MRKSISPLFGLPRRLLSGETKKREVREYKGKRGEEKKQHEEEGRERSGERRDEEELKGRLVLGDVLRKLQHHRGMEEKEAKKKGERHKEAKERQSNILAAAYRSNELWVDCFDRRYYNGL